MPRYDLSIDGLQEAQDLNLRIIAAFKPGGKAGIILKEMVIEAFRYLVAITHVDTGAYRASHRMEITDLRGTIKPDPTAQNPKTGKLVLTYATIEEGRGGEHAVYDRTKEDIGEKIATSATYSILRIIE